MVGCKYAESVTDWKTYSSHSLGKLPFEKKAGSKSRKYKILHFSRGGRGSWRYRSASCWTLVSSTTYQNYSGRDVLDDRLIFSGVFTNAVPVSELLCANMASSVVLVSVFLNLEPRGGRGSWSYLPLAPPADLLSQLPGKNDSNSVISLNGIILISPHVRMQVQRRVRSCCWRNASLMLSERKKKNKKLPLMTRIRSLICFPISASIDQNMSGVDVKGGARVLALSSARPPPPDAE